MDIKFILSISLLVCILCAACGPDETCTPHDQNFCLDEHHLWICGLVTNPEYESVYQEQIVDCRTHAGKTRPYCATIYWSNSDRWKSQCSDVPDGRPTDDITGSSPGDAVDAVDAVDSGDAAGDAR